MSIKSKLFLCLFLNISIITNQLNAQLPDSCKLNIGTNLSGVADYSTEIPFVDLMRISRVWYTKSVGDPNDPFNSEFSDDLDYRVDGYPTHIPQTISGSTYPQLVATIWDGNDGWPPGNYTVLWDGDGTLDLLAPINNIQTVGNNKITFDYSNPIGNSFELRITYSNINDPVHNIRLLMPGTEFTYEQNPFYQLWVDKASIFNTVRFMDWGSTNGWGLNEGEGYGNDTLKTWDERSKMDYYTWTHNKGIPYEMMVKYMNDYDKDGWVCVPHSASEDYVRQMAIYFRDSLETGRHIYVEYSNETWNFIFPQAQWVNHYGCDVPGVPWPEGTTQYIERTLDYWTDEFTGQESRTTRIVGIFTGWLDIAERVAFNIDENSFDAIAPTYYFGINEDLELELDALGAAATTNDVFTRVSASLPEAFALIRDVKTHVSDSLQKPMLFYEGGQHITPVPFGVIPTYEQALLDIQREDGMYDLYNQWFDSLRTLQDTNDPLLLMNFSFVAPLSAQYGSWGILETMDQDTAVIPAPKFKSIVENMNNGCSGSQQSDADNDGISDVNDNCPNVSNPSQSDYDNDGIGDLCDIPDVKVSVENGLLFSTSPEGLLMMGRDSSCYLLIIDTNGNMTTEERPCPSQ